MAWWLQPTLEVDTRREFGCREALADSPTLVEGEEDETVVGPLLDVLSVASG